MSRDSSSSLSSSRKHFLTGALVAMGSLMTLRWWSPRETTDGEDGVALQTEAGPAPVASQPARFNVQKDPRAVSRDSQSSLL